MTAHLAVLAAIAIIAALGVGVPNLLVNSQKVSAWSPQRQLRTVAAASFERQRVLNRSEFARFQVVEEEIEAARKGHRVFAQVNLGEILATPSRNAFHLVNSKRVDMLIADRGGWPVLAIEYQGEGHYQGDAVKKAALERAGVQLLEVFPGDTSEQIRARVRERLGWHGPPAASRPNTAPVASPVAAATFGRARAS